MDYESGTETSFISEHTTRQRKRTNKNTFLLSGEKFVWGLFSLFCGIRIL